VRDFRRENKGRKAGWRGNECLYPGGWIMRGRRGDGIDETGKSLNLVGPGPKLYTIKMTVCLFNV